MAHFADQVKITIDGFTLNVIHSDLKVSQKMADHHHFSFTWYYAAENVIDPVNQAKALRKYLGAEVIFTFLVNGIRLMSKGIINNLVSQDRNGSPDGMYVTGISHTASLDDNKKSRIFLELPLQNIVPGILSEGPSDFYQKEAISPTYRKEFKYLAQYNETNFEFLKRIATRYAQWFYFDGMRMQFGQLKTSKVKLINNVSLEDFKIQLNLAPHKISLGAYDENNAANVRSSSIKTSEGSRDSFSTIVGYTQGNISQPDLHMGSHTSNATDKEEIEQMVKLHTAGQDANSVYYSGTSYFPIGVGQVFTIINGTVEHELLAIEITHLSTLHGNYSCEFKAIPADVAAPHYTDVEVFAKAENQPAKVTDNNDPEGIGRVRVKFNWGNGYTTSDWMRMIQPHSGGGKGFYFIPEIGEEVLVGFEGGNIQRPFVMGTEYNGQNKSSYATENNDKKVIQTRSGNRIISDDETGDITIESQKGQTIAVIYGDGNIKLKAPKNIELEAGEDIIINAGRNMITTVGLDKTDTIQGNHTETIIGSKYSTIGLDFLIKVSGSFKEYVMGKIESHTEKERKEFASKGVDMSSEGSIKKHAQKNLNNNSGENSTQN
ncbi:MAG: type IV secretion protein Rhs [Flavobacterium sp.]|nr:MAG: type IV secretion protein Rhs [Flavobacterium sp.]